MANDALQALVDVNAAGYQPEKFVSVGCTGSNVCSCAVVERDVMFPGGAQTGTYVTSGTVLTFDNQRPDPVLGGTSPYCVQGSTLHLLQLDGNGTTVSDTVLTKQ